MQFHRFSLEKFSYFRALLMLELNFNPFPVLSTERLTLRQLNEEDKNEMFILRSDEKTMQYIPRPLAKTTEDALQLIQKINELIKNNEGINWAITMKNDPKLIGIIGYFRTAKEHFRSEVGYILNPTHERKGIMQEALTVVLDFGFSNMKLHSIEARVDPRNTASIKLLKKRGFHLAGHLKEYEFFNNQFIDTLIFMLLNPEK